MSFLPAVRQQIANQPRNHYVRVVLNYLLQHAVGRKNAVPAKVLIAELRRRGIRISKTDFQQGILAKSRDGDYFIGSGSKGYYLIATAEDARAMRDFYRTRIHAEEQNLGNLLRQARKVGWDIR